jgi:hypothetical protein
LNNWLTFILKIETGRHTGARTRMADFPRTASGVNAAVEMPGSR